MTTYRTCRYCKKRVGCPIKREIGKTITGLGITSLLHKCSSYEPPFKSGDPILVKTICDLENPLDWGEDGPPECHFPGHFLTQSGTKAHVYIMPGTLPIERTEAQYANSPDNNDYDFRPKSNGYCTLSFSRVSLNPNGSPIKVCERCKDRVEAIKKCWNIDCPSQKKSEAV